MKKRFFIAVGVVMAAAVITAATALAANGGFRLTAGDKESEDVAAPDTEVRGRMRPGLGFGFSLDVEVTDEQKAEALKQVKEQLDEQVASGRLTQEQADKIYGTIEDRGFCLSVCPNNGLGKILGEIPVIEREAAEMTEEQKAERLAQCKDRLDKMVTEGMLTQEQADEMYARMEEGGLLNFNFGGGRGKDFGGEVSFGGGRGNRQKQSPATDESGEPDTSGAASAAIFRPV